MEPEKALWIAVLAQAVKDAELLLKKVRKTPELWSDHFFRADVRHLKQFFRSQSMELGGFGFICDLMGVEPVHAAQRIEQRYLRHLVPVSEISTRTASLPAA